MAGTTPLHNRVARDTCMALEILFGKRKCEAFVESMKVGATTTRYCYPSVVAVCGEQMYNADNPPALLNPMVIIEVLSPSTQYFDRWGKFEEYRQIPSLTDYLLIEQARPFVLHFARYSATQWLVSEYEGLDKSVPLPALDVILPLAEIYRKVVLASLDVTLAASPSPRSIPSHYWYRSPRKSWRNVQLHGKGKLLRGYRKSLQPPHTERPQWHRYLHRFGVGYSFLHENSTD